MKLLFLSGNPENVLLSQQLAVFNLNYIHICFKFVLVCWSKFCGKEIIPMQCLMVAVFQKGMASLPLMYDLKYFPWVITFHFVAHYLFSFFFSFILSLSFIIVLLYFSFSCFTSSNSSVLDCRALSFIRSSRSLQYPWFCINCSFDLSPVLFNFTIWNFWRSSVLQERNCWVTDVGFLIWSGTYVRTELK